jgi:anti-sigma regulatory factor (Ser/Thr protein kinase)
VVSIGPGPLPAPLFEELSANPEEVRAVRRRVRDWARDSGLADEVVTDLQLVISEAVENAVEHAYAGQAPGRFSYRLRHGADGTLRVCVADHGRWRPPPADPGHRGRGLDVIRDLAIEFHLDADDSGTRLRCILPATRPASPADEPA